jgi:hypothetical protein
MRILGRGKVYLPTSKRGVLTDSKSPLGMCSVLKGYRSLGRFMGTNRHNALSGLTNIAG